MKKQLKIILSFLMMTAFLFSCKEETKEMDIVFCGLPRAFDGFSAWNHNHGRLQCCRNTDGITFLFFSQENLDFFCGTACRTVLFECSYAGESVLSGNDSGTSF